MDAFGGLQNFPQLANSALFPLLLASLRTQKYSPATTNDFKNEYDFIVVGAGSAGSVVASRLSEQPCVSVLLLEAGGQPPLITEVPGVDSSYYPEDLFWYFPTLPHKRAGYALPNRQATYAVGRGLGGSSTVNGLVYTRGNRKNYDEWKSLGADGWSFLEVLPYFKKLEKEMDIQYIANGFHGSDGPVTMSHPNYNPDIKKAIMKTALEMGYEPGDCNGPKQYGFCDYQSTIRNGQRCSTAKAYLVPSEGRPNLDIVTNALVTKIMFEGKRATGVQFELNGATHEVTAKKEIILSAGVINTPRLLMLSGVGPKSDLDKLKIPVVADLPVGNNFHDHVASIMFYHLHDSLPGWKERFSSNKTITHYIKKREGPLASNQALSGLAFLSANDLGKIEDKPDYELTFFETPSDFIKDLGFSPEVYKQVFEPYKDQALFGCYPIAIHPKSRGTIRLQSANPKDLPEIDLNIFDDPQDFKDLLEGMKMCHKILTSPTMVKAGAKIIDTIYPGCKPMSEDLEESLSCLIRSFVFPYFHMVGTAKMGRSSDPTTVVDPQLRVKTIQGLRVVDASIMPKIVWGHLNVPTIMVGEKASDMIKETITCK